jgi:GT2 family glycosyltransferase
MNFPKVAIVILNWNNWQDTIECLESVFQINYPNYSVILVDNHSQDDSIKNILKYAEGKINVESNFFDYSKVNKPLNCQIIKKCEINGKINADKQLTLILNDANDGFAEGNNIGIRYALKNLDADYVLLLNNDTVVDKYFLDPLIKEGEINEKIGILGSKLYYYDNPNVIWCVGGKIDWKFARGLHVGINEEDIGQYNTNQSFDYISGAALLIKTEVFNKVGLLNERYFLYFEETDFELKASENNYGNLYIPESKVWHKVSKTGGGIKNELGLYYITRNRWLFMKKWAKKGNYLIFAVLQILMAIILPISLCIKYNDKKLFLAYYKGLKDGLKNSL